jgi:hypothetical protein
LKISSGRSGNKRRSTDGLVGESGGLERKYRNRHLVIDLKGFFGPPIFHKVFFGFEFEYRNGAYLPGVKGDRLKVFSDGCLSD